MWECAVQHGGPEHGDAQHGGPEHSDAQHSDTELSDTKHGHTQVSHSAGPFGMRVVSVPAPSLRFSCFAWRVGREAMLRE